MERCDEGKGKIARQRYFPAKPALRRSGCRWHIFVRRRPFSPWHAFQPGALRGMFFIIPTDRDRNPDFLRVFMFHYGTH